MRKVLTLLQTIKAEPSTNAKVELLRRGKINLAEKGIDSGETLVTLLRILFDASVTTNIGKKKINKTVSSTNIYCDTENTFLQFIMNESTGTDEDIARCQQFLAHMDEDLIGVFSEIITQSYTFGMNVSLVNRALGFKITEPINPMLALSWEKMNDDDRLDFYAVTPKLDGCRMLVFCYDNGERVAYSRNGLKLEGLDSFLKNLSLPNGYVFDGEMLPTRRWEFENSQEQYKAITRILRKKGEKDPKQMQYHIFDCVTLEEYDSETSESYVFRRKFLEHHISNTEYQIIVPVMRYIYFAENFEWLHETLDNYTAQGEEGLMLNKMGAKYLYKRGRAIFKMKKFHTCDLKVLRVEEGSGKYSGLLGKVIVDYKGFELGVGSGFSEEQRQYYWNHPEELEDKIIEVSYFEETTNDKGGFGLRFPVFKTIRTDKNDVSFE